MPLSAVNTALQNYYVGLSAMWHSLSLSTPNMEPEGINNKKCHVVLACCANSALHSA